MENEMGRMLSEIEMLKRAVRELQISIDIEPKVREEYLQKIRTLEKNSNFLSFNSIEELKKSIENA